MPQPQESTVETTSPEQASDQGFRAFSDMVAYSFTDELSQNPAARADGEDHSPREVTSGHYVPVAPTPLANPQYISHGKRLFADLGLNDALATNADFQRIFSGDLSQAPAPFKGVGWATGYALSIYGTEYTQQCPFGTGNGYGDGRAISVAELRSGGKNWELQLKGGGPTPYCRGADGRAVLRSSVREFLAQEFMHALGVPSSRSLSLFVSHEETVMRPWYSQGSCATDPDVMVANPAAISTRVAPSFLRVGQLELFARRARQQSHPMAMDELRAIVAHAIQREYRQDIDAALPFEEQVVAFAAAFRQRLISLVCNWIRVGYCQGNFNSDNCAVGGFTLDYGPFGFCEDFDPFFQPWTGGGRHFCFFNQAAAAEANFHMFISALNTLAKENDEVAKKLQVIRDGFSDSMQKKLVEMWASKLGLPKIDMDFLSELWQLLRGAATDYTIFFRELSEIPQHISQLSLAFQQELSSEMQDSWNRWLTAWRQLIADAYGDDVTTVSENMRKINPKYTWREWLVAPAYQQAANKDYHLIHNLQTLYDHPYEEQTTDTGAMNYQRTPDEYAALGGISHYSCSS